jgi:hypothetical protein
MPTTMMAATSVLTVASQVLSACQVALSGSSSGPVNRVALYPGAEIAWDECDCGLLAINVVRMFNSRGNMLQDAGDVYQACEPPVRVASFQLTVVRCLPVTGHDVTSPPTPEQLIAAFAVQEEDSYLVWTATQCVLNQLDDPTQPKVAAQLVNDRISLGPLGGCVGTQLNFKVGWYRSCDCAPQ